jgi:hypothetical protein
MAKFDWEKAARRELVRERGSVRVKPAVKRKKRRRRRASDVRVSWLPVLETPADKRGSSPPLSFRSRTKFPFLATIATPGGWGYEVEVSRGGPRFSAGSEPSPPFTSRFFALSGEHHVRVRAAFSRGTSRAQAAVAHHLPLADAHGLLLFEGATGPMGRTSPLHRVAAVVSAAALRTARKGGKGGVRGHAMRRRVAPPPVVESQHYQPAS